MKIQCDLGTAARGCPPKPNSPAARGTQLLSSRSGLS